MHNFEKVDLLTKILTKNIDKWLTSREIHLVLLCQYPKQSKEFKSNKEIGQLLKRVNNLLSRKVSNKIFYKLAVD